LAVAFGPSFRRSLKFRRGLRFGGKVDVGPVLKLAREPSISRAANFNWRSNCAGGPVNEPKRMKDLEADSASPEQAAALR
jgi:hypothetical protein